MVSKIRHLLYSNFKEYVENYQQPYMKWRFKAECLLFLYSFLRTTTLSLIILLNRKHPNWPILRLYQYDYTWHIFQNDSAIYNETIVLLVSLLSVFTFVAQHGLYTSGAPDKMALSVFHDYIALNLEQYWQCYKSKAEITTLRRAHYSELSTTKSKSSLVLKYCPLLSELLKLYWKIKANFLIYYNLEHVHLDQLQMQQLPGYFDIPFQLRMRLIWTVIFQEVTVAVFFVFCVALLLLVFALTLVYILGTTSPLYLPWITFDYACLIAYQFVTLIQSGMTYTCTAVHMLVLYKYKTAYAVRRVTSPSQFRPSRHLLYLLREFNQLCVYVIQSNGELWGRVFFTFLLTNIPANAHLITLLVFSRLGETEKVVIWTVLFGQISAALLILLPCGAYARVIHSSAKCMVAVQGRIGVEFLLYKIKLDGLFHRLTSGHKYCISFGPLAEVTSETIMQTALIYSAFVLFTFSLKIQSKF